MDFNCIATLPTPPDPAVTPKTKQPVKQFFRASVDGAEVVPETELDITVTQAPVFAVPAESEVSLLCEYADASGLRSGFKTQTVKAPAIPDVIPPDVPGDFGEIKFEAITPEPAPTPTPDPVPEPTPEPAPVDPAPVPVDPAPADPVVDPAAPTA